MAWLPIARTPIQYEKTDGNPANGYYLKFYLAATTTPQNMATDVTGATQIAKCKLNERGFPLSNPNDEASIFIPHVSSVFDSFRYVIYPTAADADANNFASAVVNLSAVSQTVDVDSYLTTTVKTVDTYADLSAALSSATIGQQLSLLGHTVAGVGGGIFDVVSSSGLVADNGTTVINGGKAAVRQNQSPLTPQMFGAVGDVAGTAYADVAAATDDSIAFQNMFDDGRPWYIPAVKYSYKITQTLFINSDGLCHGVIRSTTAIGGAANDYDRFCIVIEESGYPIKRRIEGLTIEGNVTVRAAGVNGIRNDCYNSILIGCNASQLNYGIVGRSFSQTYLKCNAWQNNVNFDAYARDSSHEINTLTIDGGNYDTPVQKSCVIGDLTWSDSMISGNSHGVVINLVNGANFDGGEVWIDNCSAINIEGIYIETSVSDKLIRLGGAFDGSAKTVTIHKNFLKNAKYCVYCETAVDDLNVGPNFVTQVTVSEVRLSSDIYGVTYRPGVSVGSFANGQAVGIAFRSLATASIQFGAFTIERERLLRGAQTSEADPGKFYPSGKYRDGVTEYSNISASSCIFYRTPSTGKAGTVSGTNFTFTNVADSYAFNGGDRIVTVPAGAVYVRSVNYETGVAVIDGGVTAAGAATISQVAVTLHAKTITLTGAAPTSGTWSVGDVCVNGIVAVGTPKGWRCTVAGTPGTWVSEGNL